MKPDGKELAPDGQVWVCAACGKRARSRYGFNVVGGSTVIDRGWDTSCMMHAILCHAEKRDGVFMPVDGVKPS